jgi:hypothetical protein
LWFKNWIGGPFPFGNIAKTLWRVTASGPGMGPEVAGMRREGAPSLYYKVDLTLFGSLSLGRWKHPKIVNKPGNLIRLCV